MICEQSICTSNFLPIDNESSSIACVNSACFDCKQNNQRDSTAANNESWFNPCPCRDTGLHYNTILVCWRLMPPPLPRWVPFFIDPSWLRLSGLSFVGLVPSWNPEPPRRVLAVVCTGGQYVSDDQACIVCLHWQCSLYFLVQFSTTSFIILSFQETPNMLLCHLWWAASSRFNNVSVSGHSSAM